MTTLKHLIPLIAVGVHRDITTTVQTQVPEHEIPILQAVHGESNVYPGEPTGAMTHIDPATEYDRLKRKYGDDKVEDAYGNAYKANREITEMVLAASKGTEEVEGHGIQLEGPDSPAAPKLSLPASQVQRPPQPEGRKARQAATA